MKEIKGFHDYYADKNGIIYSCKNNNNMKPIAQWKDGRGRYLLVHIIDDNGYAMILGLFYGATGYQGSHKRRRNDDRRAIVIFGYVLNLFMCIVSPCHFTGLP